MIPTYKLRCLLLSPVLVFSLFGCKGIPDFPAMGSSNVSPEAQQLDNQLDDFSQTVTEGALLGAITGSLVALATGGNKQAALKGALVGAAGGAAYGYYIAGKKQEYADKESALNALKQDLTDTNDNLSAMVSTARKLLIADKQRLKELESHLAQNKQQQQQYDDLMAQIQNDRKVVAKAIQFTDKKYKQAMDNLANFEKQFDVENEAELQALLTKYNEQNAELASIDSELSALAGQS
ncbi:glycine zipper domain-containing protein [Pseudoalteromonas maricaloris]|uniref:Glycine zipper domain-containing protein n=1 Tax=Pseudoalteromonas maricaloris TaxID=184924 RepID=A0A8I2KRC6_9GAMM|nr:MULTISPECIES: glycine zipper domain-containing protein [Pseudoalteromonas]KID38531.1 hypothetical protein QT15_03410 [Pseudoalteromonas flavipulchra NCIMB 2033 = ATCC BAA-314]MBD0783222.1 hypothetical protein [Pseudoalteromonas flavipulchra]MBE0371884.1 hypothetical protein [Pseudoalteromonas flavipulchra NCIMB 2033 = ATCC BAA-314]NLR22567.1 hypothetical protein [Pseudoalteromonas maricaloris]USE68347.1 hypothetical protein CTT31_04115 [Pseudoalteromonas flavipulchra]